MKDPKRELAQYGRKIYSDKFVIGAGGNISVRRGNKVYIKASGISLENSVSSDYNEIDIKTGKTVCFKGPCSIEVPMHLACYKARPDVGAVIHTHSVYGTAAGFIASKIGFISYEFMLAMKSAVPSIPYKKAGSLALAALVRRAIEKHNGILLRNHGIIVVGKDLKEAYMRALALERACEVFILARSSGAHIPILPESELKRLA